jgi:hypothetical protein
MRHLFLILLFVFPATLCSISQKKDIDEYLVVLNKKQVGKEISFSKNNADHYDSLVLVYLGQISTNKGEVLKIMTSRWYWGTSPRASSRVIIFNVKNQVIGNYFLTMTYEVPTRVEGRSLVFVNDKKEYCTDRRVTRVDFSNGIPKNFFLGCDGDNGDTYEFSPER